MLELPNIDGYIRRFSEKLIIAFWWAPAIEAEFLVSQHGKSELRALNSRGSDSSRTPKKHMHDNKPMFPMNFIVHLHMF